MKTVLALAAILGLSISSAAAMCAGHDEVTASVEKETTVASIAVDADGKPIKKEEQKQAE
jgi:hypothetical protein